MNGILIVFAILGLIACGSDPGVRGPYPETEGAAGGMSTSIETQNSSQVASKTVDCQNGATRDCGLDSRLSGKVTPIGGQEMCLGGQWGPCYVKKQ